MCIPSKKALLHLKREIVYYVHAYFPFTREVIHMPMEVERYYRIDFLTSARFCKQIRIGAMAFSVLQPVSSRHSFYCFAAVRGSGFFAPIAEVFLTTKFSFRPQCGKALFVFYVAAGFGVRVAAVRSVEDL